jgi:lipid-A-disaccharide synthase
MSAAVPLLDPDCLFIAAGEASGDHYAAALFHTLKQRHPQLRALGLGGMESRAAGIDTVVDLQTVSVMGLVEVLAHYGQLKRALNTLIAALETNRPALLVVIDFQEFNQRLARAARARGIPVLFFVAPQVWAWRPKRARRFREVADHLAVLFDFEVPLFAQYGLPTTHVGHPLRDLMEPDVLKSREPQRYAQVTRTNREALGLDPDCRWIGLLPGSRRSEIGRLLPLMLSTATHLLARYPDWKFVLPLASSIDPAWFQEQLHAAQPTASLLAALTIVPGQARRAMAASDVLCIASGTATLEAALIGTPMVISYRTNPLTYWIAKHLVHIERIGLPNIILGRNAVPELIQSDATPEALAAAVCKLVSDTDVAQAQKKALEEIQGHLGRPGALNRLAILAESLMGSESHESAIQPTG